MHIRQTEDTPRNNNNNNNASTPPWAHKHSLSPPHRAQASPHATLQLYKAAAPSASLTASSPAVAVGAARFFLADPEPGVATPRPFTAGVRPVGETIGRKLTRCTGHTRQTL